tara:strand:- start:815 stop:2302 length:1488 start_codon:yes stop_codon:yes gene_type:complete
MSDFFPLIVDASGTPAIKEIPSGDVLDLTGVTIKAVSVNTTLAVAGNTTVGGTLGVTGAVTANAGINVDNINIDGTTIAQSSGDLLLDVAGNIVLDAGGGGVYFKDDGTTIGFFQNDGGDFRMISSVSDKDIMFLGNDGGSTITALTLDMSNAGAATFNAGLIVGGDISHVDTSNFDIENTSASQNIIFKTTPSGGSKTERMRITHDGMVFIENDSGKFKAGASGDLQIYHDGSHSYVQDTGAGHLRLSGNDLQLVNAAVDANYIICANGGAVDLYHNGSKKLETASSGVTVTGVVAATSLDISGDVDVDGTLETDNLTVAGSQGSDGQVLTSTGSGVGWEDSAGTTINNNANNRLITGSGTAGTLEGEANLTYDGDVIQVNGSANVTRQGPIGQASGAVQTWNVSSAANTFFEPNNNNTVMNPGGAAVAGAVIQVEIAMGSTVYAIAWQNKFKFVGDVAPTITPTALKTDIFTFRYSGTVWQEIGRSQNLTQTV